MNQPLFLKKIIKIMDVFSSNYKMVPLGTVKKNTELLYNDRINFTFTLLNLYLRYE